MTTAPSQRHCDTAVVGSSPLLLIAATIAASRGEQVELLEARPALGGAWQCETWDGLPDVELGAHYLYCSPPAYEYLASVGVDLEPMSPRPFAVRGRRRFPLWTEHKVGRLVEAAADRDRDGVVREARRLLTYGRYLYPVGGAAAMVRSLSASAVRAGVRIRTDAPVSAIRVLPGGRGVRCEIGSATLDCRRVITGESARIPLIHDGGGVPAKPRWTATEKTHVLLRFDAHECRPLTYVECVARSAGARRVALAHRPSSDTLVWAVEIQGRPGQEGLDSTVRSLLDIGLVDPGATPLAGGIVTCPGSFWPAADRARLRPWTAPWLTVLTSWVCFGDSLVDHLRGRTG